MYDEFSLVLNPMYEEGAMTLLLAMFIEGPKTAFAPK